MDSDAFANRYDRFACSRGNCVYFDVPFTAQIVSFARRKSCRDEFCFSDTYVFDDALERPAEPPVASFALTRLPLDRSMLGSVLPQKVR